MFETTGLKGMQFKWSFTWGEQKKQTMKQKKYPKKGGAFKLFCISLGRGCHSHVDSHPIWQITGRHQKLLHGCSAIWSAREISSVARPCTLTGKNWLPVPVVAQGECKTHGKFEHTTTIYWLINYGSSQLGVNMVDLCHRHFDFSLEQQPKKNTERSKTSFVSCVGSRGHQAAEFAAREGRNFTPQAPSHSWQQARTPFEDVKICYHLVI